MPSVASAFAPPAPAASFADLAPVRLHYTVLLDYHVHHAGAAFIFNVQAAHTRRQQVLRESVTLSQPLQQHSYTDPATLSRYLRVTADAGPLVLRCDTVVDILHHRADPLDVTDTPIAGLPGEVLPYLSPSRFCQSDRLHTFAWDLFGSLQHGYTRAQAVHDWVLKHVVFTSNSSSSSTSACDTLLEKRGVCRDFAHLMIALCRAVNLPARFTTGIDYGADPVLGPQDFHAYVEVFLGGHWYLFDPSGTAIPMGFIRLATGRDAADAAFASVFGNVAMGSVGITIAPVPGADGLVREPQHVAHALSTDGDAIAID